MTTRDWLYTIALILSFSTMIVSIITYRKTVKRDLNAQGDSELKVYEIIAKAEKDLLEFNMKMLTCDVESLPSFTLCKPSYIEYMLNSYEIACQRYIDGKLDLERFKKTYQARIKKVCTNAEYSKFINTNEFNYAALSKVNTNFNNPEK